VTRRHHHRRRWECLPIRGAACDARRYVDSVADEVAGPALVLFHGADQARGIGKLGSRMRAWMSRFVSATASLGLAKQIVAA